MSQLVGLSLVMHFQGVEISAASQLEFDAAHFFLGDTTLTTRTLFATRSRNLLVVESLLDLDCFCVFPPCQM